MQKCFFISFWILFLTLPAAAQPSLEQLKDVAMTFQRQGDFPNALKALDKAIALAPEDIALLTDKAYVLYRLEAYENARTLVKPLIDRPDAEVRTFQVAGNIFKELEDVAASEKMYKKALAKFPASGALHSEYGELLLARKKPSEAIALWEKGIKADPGYSGNYFHAAKFHHTSGDKVWAIFYAEIFLNLESYSSRTVELKAQLLDTYRLFFSRRASPSQGYTARSTPFSEAFRKTLEKQGFITERMISDANKLIMIRTRFILDWFEGPGKEFPHKLFDHHQFLLREGLFQAYNYWLFGAASSMPEYRTWADNHSPELNAFNRYQRNRVFRMPANQYYGQY